jgi:serine/threonine protein kinase
VGPFLFLSCTVRSDNWQSRFLTLNKFSSTTLDSPRFLTLASRSEPVRNDNNMHLNQEFGNLSWCSLTRWLSAHSCPLDSFAYERESRMSMQGSIYWMAPEVARNKGYSAKVDIWWVFTVHVRDCYYVRSKIPHDGRSTGCLVLEMLTGRHPWHGVSGHILYLIGTGNSPPIPQSLHPQARDFLAQCFIM